MPHIFPELPAAPPDQQWAPNVIAGYDRIQSIFHRATSILEQASMDAVRLGIQLDRIRNDCIPLFEAIVQVSENEMPLLIPWLHAGATAIEKLVDDLVQAHGASQGRYGSSKRDYM